MEKGSVKRKTKNKENRADKSKQIKLVFAFIMIFTGLLILSYPFVSYYLAKKNATEAVVDYAETVETMEAEEIDAIKEAAKAYNELLKDAEKANAEGAGEKISGFIDLMDPGEVLGYITIPVIKCKLPIYEGTNDNVLTKGVGHLTQTSFPMGGESTHSALSGHRGLAEAELFTNLDKVSVGDQFYLHILILKH